jgi:hypothetical protein
MSPVGLKSKKRCAGDAQQKLELKREGGNWSPDPDGWLTLRQTGRLTVGRNITLTLTST